MSGGARIGEIMGQMGKCPHVDADLARSQASNGAWHIFYWCDDCKSNVSREMGFRGTWIAKDDPKIAHIPFESIRIQGLERVWRLCSGPCRRVTHCELHHWAPREKFGDAADDWPMTWLCRPCHELWHEKMGRVLRRPPASGAA